MSSTSTFFVFAICFARGAEIVLFPLPPFPHTAILISSSPIPVIYPGALKLISLRLKNDRIYFLLNPNAFGKACVKVKWMLFYEKVPEKFSRGAFGRRVLFLFWQKKRKRTTFSRLRIYPYFSTVYFYKLFDKGKAQTCSSEFS
ncbi:hypothetical protein SDC9_162700 [bioreactor metagenome]|uniref:Uncharacterized protein n=1 Tax=bioreactor metagenome TaxID=1076179 RepID=A0A645FPS7_9ZZZZ